MSLDMADRMVVIGISANNMTARAETDCKKEHLSPESTFHPGDGNKGFRSNPFPHSLCGLGLEALN